MSADAQTCIKSKTAAKVICLPDSVTAVEDECFRGCPVRMARMTRNEQLAARALFQDCMGLRQINLPDGLKKIAEQCFQHCGIEEIAIPHSVRAIKSAAFCGCDKLKKVTFTEDSALAEIEKSAFQACSSLKTIALPARLKTIGEAAFKQCASLQFVTLSENLEMIGASCFFESGICEIHIPSSVQAI